MKDFTRQLIGNSRIKLNGWKLRYDLTTYYEKVAINTVYELLLLEAMWPWINEKCFTGACYFDSFDDAVQYVANSKVPEFIAGIHPKVRSVMLQRDQLPNLDLVTYRKYLQAAAVGDAQAGEIIETTYSMHFASIYLLYSWAARGLMGDTRAEAMASLADVVFPVMDELIPVYRSMNTSVQFSFENPHEVKACAAVLIFPGF